MSDVRQHEGPQAPDDYALSIDDVALRLNKSVRTVHRYKESGRLSFVVGATQGNPIFFSSREVDDLARELYPQAPAPPEPPADESFTERLARVERTLDRLLADEALRRADREELGRLLIRLGNLLQGG